MEEKFAQVVREFCLVTGWTQRDLASEAGYTFGTFRSRLGTRESRGPAFHVNVADAMMRLAELEAGL